MKRTSRTFARPFLDLQEAEIKVALKDDSRHNILSADADVPYEVTLSPGARTWREVLREAFPEGNTPKVEILVYWRPASPVQRLIERVPLDPSHDGDIVITFSRKWYQHGPDNRIVVRIILAGETDSGSILSAREKGSILFEAALNAGTTQGGGGYVRISRADFDEGPGEIAFDGHIYHILVNSRLDGGEEATAIAQLLARCLRHARHRRDEYRAEDGTDEDGETKGNPTIEALLSAQDRGKSVADMVAQESGELADENGSALERWCWKTVWDNREGAGR